MKAQKTGFMHLLSFILILMLTACSGRSSGNGFVDGRNFGGIVQTSAAEEESTRSTAVHTGACFGVIVDIDTTGDAITILDLVTGAENKYSYTGGTYIMDKYGKDIAVSQLAVGDIVEGGYDTGTRRLIELKKSNSTWENQKVTNFEIDRLSKTMRIGNSLYEYRDNLVIVSDGRVLKDVSEISNQDELIVRGSENTIYSVVITKGHGYVTLSDDEYFEGGLVMIGSRIARKVTKGMVIEVPEGEYVLEIAKDGVGGQIDILVTKNQETRVSVGSLKGEVREMGNIRFNIKPADAKLYIDGKETDYSGLVNLYYDVYKIRVEADGYVTYHADMVVSESYEKKEIELGRMVSEQESTASSEGSTEQTSSKAEESATETAEADKTTTAGTTAAVTDSTTAAPTATTPTATTPTVTAPTVTTPTATAPTVTTPSVPVPGMTEKASEGMGSDMDHEKIEGYKIHVEAPSGASVYFDGEYVGVAPVSFDKVSGEHTIIFKQNGYEPKTYTVTISSDKADSHYSYPALVPNSN
ncbi:MAG: PEGA domain-containing protein [Lachnospiraceae bacterium]|nr:PEGA domain-containing protein [Lachnospiraceae bacterium]